jgi:hypothetical protein
MIILVSDTSVLIDLERGSHPKLSLPDAYAYSLASVRGWTLLSGDGELRALAEANRIPFSGVLWVCDQLFDRSVIGWAAVADGLDLIAAHPRCRLPQVEINLRLERFRQPRG